MKRLAFVLVAVVVLAASPGPAFAAGDNEWPRPSQHDDWTQGWGQWGSVPTPYKPWSMFGTLNPYTSQPKPRRDDPWSSSPRSRDADRHTMPDIGWPFRDHNKDNR
jgi:hypothetical protein